MYAVEVLANGQARIIEYIRENNSVRTKVICTYSSKEEAIKAADSWYKGWENRQVVETIT